VKDWNGVGVKVHHEERETCWVVGHIQVTECERRDLSHDENREVSRK
jgi:hypothetical protein